MFGLSGEALDPGALREGLRDPRAGACATFEGWVRNHHAGRAVVRLEYEAYPEMAEKEGERIVREACARFDLYDAVCIHRTGELAIGDCAVWVGAIAAHRAEAFAACRYIIDQVKARVPVWKKEHYVDGDSGWVNCEGCAAHAPSPDAEYYARQVRLPQVGEEGQRRLGESRVLVVGAGGLGSPALLYLASAGVGHLGICEHDRLEASNLHRQILFDHADVGGAKAVLAADRLRRLNPFVDVEVHETRLSPGNAEALFRRYDLVLDCTDNFETKFLINDAAVLTGTPAVFSSIYQFEGQLQLVDPARGTACMRCIWPEAPEAGCVGSCAEVGVLGAVPGVFGTLQAVEALKRLLGLPESLGSDLLILGLLDYSFLRVRALRNPACPACGEGARIEFRGDGEPIEIDWEEFSRRGVEAFQLIDIREAAEVAVQPLRGPGAVHVPASAFDPADPRLDPRRPWLLCCAYGIRSRSLALHLRRKGFARAYSLRGGAAALRTPSRSR